MPPATQDRLAKRLDLAGIARKPAEWALLGVCLGIGIAATLSLVTSYVFIGVLAGRGVGWLAMRLSLSMRIIRRRAAFSDQLPDLLQLIASALQAGFSLPQALDAVVREDDSPPPASSPGPGGGQDRRSISRAGWRRSRTGWTPTTCAGPSWPSASSRASAATSPRYCSPSRRRSASGPSCAGRCGLSAEGRLSAYILLALPVLVGAWLFVSSRQYMRPLYTTPIGRVHARGGHRFLLVGAFWMRKMVKVEV